MVDRGSGTPVVLLPGIQGRWEWMKPAVDALAARGRVVTFSFCDEPTSGFSYRAERGLENYLLQIEEALDRARVDKAVLVGVSYSGPLAAEFAARHPHRVKGLVLASALPTDWRPDARAQFYLKAPRLLSPVFLLDSPSRVLPEIRASLPTVSAQVRFAAGQAQRSLRAFLSPSRMAMRLRWHGEFTFADPSGISRPVLVITGEDGLDRVVAPSLTRRYLGALPAARHVVLEQTGHIGMLTRPHRFADLIHQFADELEGERARATA